jgi:hypothetical protein
MGRTEGPDDAFPAQPLTHKTILGHIFIIVITDKIMRANLPVYNNCGQDNKAAYNDIRPYVMSNFFIDKFSFFR